MRPGYRYVPPKHPTTRPTPAQHPPSPPNTHHPHPNTHQTHPNTHPTHTHPNTHPIHPTQPTNTDPNTQLTTVSRSWSRMNPSGVCIRSAPQLQVRAAQIPAQPAQTPSTNYCIKVEVKDESELGVYEECAPTPSKQPTPPKHPTPPST